MGDLLIIIILLNGVYTTLTSFKSTTKTFIYEYDISLFKKINIYNKKKTNLNDIVYVNKASNNYPPDSIENIDNDFFSNSLKLILVYTNHFKDSTDKNGD
jgi:hypothetical protein